jgi:glutamine amidotransferase
VGQDATEEEVGRDEPAPVLLEAQAGSALPLFGGKLGAGSREPVVVDLERCDPHADLAAHARFCFLDEPRAPPQNRIEMCRVVGYLGRPMTVEHILYETDSSLVTQVHSPQMTALLNLAGFGMAAWDATSHRPDEPFVYRTTNLPAFDRNLRNLARKIDATCLLAHVRGCMFGGDEVVSEQNLHPFRFHGVNVTLAHNGHLREFSRMRFDLIGHVRPEFAKSIAGTTDSEWLYALLLSQLDDPFGEPEADELIEAIVRTLAIVRDARARHGIDTTSPANLFVTTGRCLVATRFSFDYGWYPDDDPLLEIDLPYVSLWYTLGGSYVERDGEWEMVGDGPAESFLIGSEPLTRDISTWLEVPEYSVLSASLRNGHVETACCDLAA